MSLGGGGAMAWGAMPPGPRRPKLPPLPLAFLSLRDGAGRGMAPTLLSSALATPDGARLSSIAISATGSGSAIGSSGSSAPSSSVAMSDLAAASDWLIGGTSGVAFAPCCSRAASSPAHP